VRPVENPVPKDVVTGTIEATGPVRLVVVHGVPGVAATYLRWTPTFVMGRSYVVCSQGRVAGVGSVPIAPRQDPHMVLGQSRVSTIGVPVLVVAAVAPESLCPAGVETPGAVVTGVLLHIGVITAVEHDGDWVNPIRIAAAAGATLVAVFASGRPGVQPTFHRPHAVEVVGVVPAFRFGVAEVSQDVEVATFTATADEPTNADEVTLGGGRHHFLPLSGCI